MCEPATIIAGLSAVAALGGTYAQQQGRQEAIESQDRAAAASVARQREYQDQAHKLFQNSLEQNTAENVNADAAKRTEQRAQSLIPLPGPGTGEGREGESGAVAAAGAKGAASARDDLQTQGMARATLGGAGDAFRDLAVKTAPNAEGIGRLATNMQVENSLLPLSLASAGRAGGGMRELGSIVSGVGNLGAQAAGSGIADDAWGWLKGQMPVSSPAVPEFTVGTIY